MLDVGTGFEGKLGPKWDQNRPQNGSRGEVGSGTDFGSILGRFFVDFGLIFGRFLVDFGSLFMLLYLLGFNT